MTTVFHRIILGHHVIYGTLISRIVGSCIDARLLCRHLDTILRFQSVAPRAQPRAE